MGVKYIGGLSVDLDIDLSNGCIRLYQGDAKVRVDFEELNALTSLLQECKGIIRRLKTYEL